MPVLKILAVRWPNKGWSRPLLPNHGELAASEHAQLEALFRAALGDDARTNGDGFVWDKVDRYWWVSIANAAPTSAVLTED